MLTTWNCFPMQNSICNLNGKIWCENFLVPIIQFSKTQFSWLLEWCCCCFHYAYCLYWFYFKIATYIILNWKWKNNKKKTFNINLCNKFHKKKKKIPPLLCFRTFFCVILLRTWMKQKENLTSCFIFFINCKEF